MKYFIILILISILLYLPGCGENATGPDYTVIDELFYQKDYDSVTNGCQPPSEPSQNIKIKKFRAEFDFRAVNGTIDVICGEVGNWHIQYISEPGHYNIEFIFNPPIDTTVRPFYTICSPVNCDTCYAVVQNFKAYRSY